MPFDTLNTLLISNLSFTKSSKPVQVIIVIDLAICPEAAKHKNAEGRKIVGDADILLFPDIHAGNIAYKFLVHTTEFKNGCILTGTKAPAILTSRSDSMETKVNSIALAAVVAEAMKKKNS